ncbi:Uncharacterised protein [Serratia fonticola]|uniref:Uncharacterized protein n=1 Tax=Serratia fonticola TaxID=47917 RepID=A0A4U9TC04_SERFO|nr:Uncharacterised protein [Serratia fonticola]
MATLSETPVTLVPLGCQLLTSLAATGSVTVVNTTGIVLVAATTDCAAGVEIATIASGLVTDKFTRNLPSGGRISLRALELDLDLILVIPRSL